MKVIQYLLLILSIDLFADDLVFFKQQALKDKKEQSGYKYEDIISGGAAFVIGNVGYFTTSSTPLRLSYSLVQTVGIINVSDGVFHLNNPSKNDYYHEMLRQFPDGQDKKRNVRFLSRNLIAITARSDRAQRLAMFYRSGLLAAQYIINTLDNKTSDDLKNIYYFMAGINLITASYSYFMKSEYEQYYERPKIKTSMIPYAVPEGAGLACSWRF
jgi:hypothetical protein